MSDTSHLTIPVDSLRWAVYTEKGTVKVDTKLAPEVFWEAVAKMKKERK